MRKKIAAILASITLTITMFFAPVNAPKAQAAGFGMCSKWITTYAGTAGVTTYRASILFAAARLQIETGINRVIGLTPTTPLAFDDYAPSPVKPVGPIDATSRATITDEVKSLLGL